METATNIQQSSTLPTKKRVAGPSEDEYLERSNPKKLKSDEVLQMIKQSTYKTITMLYHIFYLQKFLDKSLDQAVPSSAADFYSPRLLCSRLIYLNKSNTKWILIGIMPGDNFLPVAYFCGRDVQVRIPHLDTFLERLADLAGVGPLGTATNAVFKSSGAGSYDLTITKTDFASGTYKIWSAADNQRCVFVATTTLEYLRGAAKPLAALYNSLDGHLIEEEFEKSVLAVTTIANLLDCCDCQLLEAEMYHSKPSEVNMNLFSETLVNFRNYFYRQVRKQLKKH